MQCIAYAIYITPVFFMWEKLIGTHYKPNYIRLPSRLPVGRILFCWHRTCADRDLVDARCRRPAPSAVMKLTTCRAVNRRAVSKRACRH